MKKFDPVIEAKDDGNVISEVREWSLEKYNLVGSYCNIFTSGMFYKWDQLVYIDLFAGSGYSRIKESGKIFYGSPLIAMSIPNPFTKYIFCEKDPKLFNSLAIRIERDFSHLNYELIPGDANENISKILKAIPPFDKNNTLLPFCFVDPFSLRIKFSTIRSLGNNLMDFLILLALNMDGKRNLEIYLKEENRRIEEFLGIKDWKEKFDKDKIKNKTNFVKFLADIYQSNMAGLGYQKHKNMHLIRSNDKNLPLYYLAFFSKHPRGVEFFKKVEKLCSPQLKLDL